VIAHPVKRRRAKHSVERAIKRQELQIGFDERDALRESRLQVLARRAQHIFREVHGHHAAARQQIEEFSGDAPRPASGVQYGFIATQAKPRQHSLAPKQLRRGEFVIGAGVPFARLLRHLILLNLFCSILRLNMVAQ
jgi:hypothetical protein